MGETKNKTATTAKEDNTTTKKEQRCIYLETTFNKSKICEATKHATKDKNAKM